MFYGTYLCHLDKKGGFLVPKSFLKPCGDGKKMRTLYFSAETVLCVYRQMPKNRSHRVANCSFTGRCKIPDIYTEYYHFAPGDELLLRGCGDFFTISKLPYFPIHAPGLKAALEKPDGRIHALDAAEVQCLDIENEPMLTAEELRPFTELFRLRVKNCGLKDIGFLTSMPLLLHLDISGNNITDARPIGSLAHLTSLDISGNPIHHTDSLASLSQLETLAAVRCGISNIDFLKELPAIRELYLDDNRITKLCALTEKHSLRVLHFTNNAVPSVSVLLPLKNLRELRFSGNPIESGEHRALLLHSILNRHKIVVLPEAAYHKKQKAFRAVYAEELGNDDLLNLLLDLIFVRQTEEVLLEDEHRYTANVSIDTKPLALAVERLVRLPHSQARQRILRWIYEQGTITLPTKIDYIDGVSAGKHGTLRFSAVPGGGFIGPDEHFTIDNSEYTRVNLLQQMLPPEAMKEMENQA